MPQRPLGFGRRDLGMGRIQGAQSMKWAAALTTVPERRGELLPRTLASLANAGFAAPRIFLDGGNHSMAESYERQFGTLVTARHPKIRTYGNWVLALAETYIREPTADRYAVFQD